MALDDARFERFRARVVTSPAAPTLVVAVGVGASGTLLPYPIASRPELGLFDTTLASVAHMTLLAGTRFVIGTYLCRAVYRVDSMGHLYSRHLTVDPMQAEPLFAQLIAAARGSATLILYTLLWVVTVPGGLSNVGFVGIAVVINLVAVGLYLVPLLRLHGLLVVEKRRMIAAAHRRVRAVSDAVHEGIDARAFGDLDALGKGLAALQIEIAVVERASTWPWHPELTRA